jgi:hypothetical protein
MHPFDYAKNTTDGGSADQAGLDAVRAYGRFQNKGLCQH